MNCMKWQKGGGVKQQVQNLYWIFLKPKNWSRGWRWLGQRMSLALNYRYLVCWTAAVPVRYCVVLAELCSGDHEGHKQILQIHRGNIWILKCTFLCGIWMPPRQLWWNQLICNLKLGIFAFKVKIRCLNYWAGKKEKTKPNLEKFVRVWKCILFPKGNTLFLSLFFSDHLTVLPVTWFLKRIYLLDILLLVDYILFNCPRPPPELVPESKVTMLHLTKISVQRQPSRQFFYSG